MRKKLINIACVIAFVALMLTFIGCGDESNSGGSTGDATSPVSSTAAGQLTFGVAMSGAENVLREDGVRVITLPLGECADVTSTPIEVYGEAVFGLHEKSGQRNESCAAHSGYATSMVRVNPQDGQVHIQDIGTGMEATLTFDADRKRLLLPSLNGKGLLFFDLVSNSIHGESAVAGAAYDSAALNYRDFYYVGSVNTPDQCQKKPEERCGALFAVDESGKLITQLGVNQPSPPLLPDGLRAWMTAAPTASGGKVFAGTGSDLFGTDEETFRGGCSVLGFDASGGGSLSLSSLYDEGIKGCNRLGKMESAVLGEVVLTGSRAWVQYKGSGDGRPEAHVAQLDHDLNFVCEASFPVIASQSNFGSYYQAPTVDKDGNAYVIANVVDPELHGALYRIDAGSCATTLLSQGSGQSVATPTLVDDQFVLFAIDGELRIFNLQGEPVKAWKLGDEEKVATSPVILDGNIVVVAANGTITIIPGEYDGYGEAWWPRFRHDNQGSAALPN